MLACAKLCKNNVEDKNNNPVLQRFLTQFSLEAGGSWSDKYTNIQVCKYTSEPIHSLFWQFWQSLVSKGGKVFQSSNAEKFFAEIKGEAKGQWMINLWNMLRLFWPEKWKRTCNPSCVVKVFLARNRVDTVSSKTPMEKFEIELQNMKNRLFYCCFVYVEITMSLL